MRKISGQLLSSKPVSLSRAAKLITRFAAVDNGSSAAVSLYLQRTADAFSHLVQFHNKRPKNCDVENSPNRKKARKSETDTLEENADEKAAKDLKSKGKRDKKTIVEAVDVNPNLDEVKDLKSEEKEQKKEEKKKKKKMKSDSNDSKKQSKKKKRIVEGLYSC